MNKKLQVWMPLLLSITMIIGMMFGYKMRDSLPGKKFFSLDKPFPVQEVMDLVKDKYVDDVKINELSDTAIVAILKKLDPHSVFIPSEELDGVNEDIAGSFFGIGVEFDIIDDTINIVNIIPDGPSSKAGIRIGDKIIKVNDSAIAGKKLPVEKIRKLLRGEVGTQVSVGILRNGEVKSISITRGVIPVSSVDASYMIGNGIGYIRLNKFSQTTYREFMKALEGLQKQGLKKLMLDLRGNGGGVLDEAVSIADEFLDGDKLITYTEGKHFPKKEYRCKRPGLFEKGELVVLADEGTASASEVLIGALQDWDRATIMGRRSFGKGLVQEQYDLSDGSALRLTVARYYTPIGRSIQRSYENGESAYYNEISDRYTDGEMISADSIKNDTSKVYKTKGGKIVYGGGGITPDIFIPLDTIGFGHLSNAAYRKGTINKFSYNYYLANATALNTFKTPEEFKNKFSFTDDGWKQFDLFAAKDSVNLDKVSPKEKDNFILLIKSGIARELWRNEGFYEMINSDDTVVKKGYELLNK